MGNFISEGMALEQTLEHVSHDDEEIGGEGVTLAQSTLAVDPLPRFTIHHHTCPFEGFFAPRHTMHQASHGIVG
jgi:hypothetical protein